MLALCRLCGRKNELQESHIVPKFLFKWLKDTSVTKKLRQGDNINKRTQDGLKLPWLCVSCEKILSKYEKYFADKVFYPLLNTTSRVNYDENMLKFCVSLSWRFLKYYLEKNSSDEFPAQLKIDITNALNAWGDFLLEVNNNIGSYEQHFYNFRGKISGGAETNINRYLQRSVAMDVVYNENVALVYCKLPNFLIIGYIKLAGTSKYRQTRISLKHGTMKPMEYNFPSELWEYMQKKAGETARFKASISPQQQNKIAQSYKTNFEEIKNSETWKSLENDIDVFGENVVINEGK